MFLEKASSARKKPETLGRKTEATGVSLHGRLVELSVAKLVIIPFQDILGLGPEHEMNRRQKDGNSQWRA